ncbi:hypothetical protein FQN54_004459 [Arachnomyces sp. PD_36]|nr:hypothetical protein FQN54_004459 [Arachnomyces sp. PD_36]
MFHDGDLQSGISLALRESKYVVLLVRDDSDVSSAWEQYFADEEITTKLQPKAIVLRIHGESQEAGFLSAFCPIDTTQLPTLIVVKDGQLLDYFVVGVRAQEVKARLLAAVGEGPPVPTPQAQQGSYAPAQAAPVTTPQSQQRSHAPTQASQPTPATSNSPTQQPGPGPSEQGTEAQRRANIRAGKQPAAEDNNPETNKTAEILSWREEQRKIAQQKEEEKRRIQERIEQDKKERKQETEEKRKEVHKKATATMRPPSLQPMSTLTPQPVRLQIRLIDGTSIRNSFAPEKTIHDDVRPWIDQQRTDGGDPYRLKQVMAPHPNRVFTTEEESKPLSDLQLSTNANMVIIPLRGPASISSTDSSSAIANGAFSGYNFLLRLIMGSIGLIAWFLGFRQAPDATSGATTQSTPQSTPQSTQQTPGVQLSATASGSGGRARSSGVNFRTLADQRREEEDEQFYNGNQLNFQPRGPDEDEDL